MISSLDCFLTPLPCYNRVKGDLGERGHIEVIGVNLTADDNFQLTVDKLHSTYEMAKSQVENQI